MTDWVQKQMARLVQEQAREDQKGGPGSGHFGHAGRPGKRGGSLPGKGGVSGISGQRSHPELTIDMLRKMGGMGMYMSKPEGDVDAWASEAWADQVNGLSEDERNALYSYKEDSSYINDSLLEGQETYRVPILDAALARSSVPEDVTVYKGLKERYQAKLIPGDVIELPEYSSTSFSPRVAGTFGVGWLEIRVPKGAHGLYIERIDDRGELELLLPRNQQYRVISTGAEQFGEDSFPHAVLEVVP